MPITVVNKYACKATDSDVYIGRGSVFGNPYTHLPSSRADAIRVATRAEACKKYEDIFATKIAPKARIELLRLIHKAINHEPITLVCFCAPKQCHGDYLKKVIDEAVLHFTSNPLALVEFNKTYELYCLPKYSD